MQKEYIPGDLVRISFISNNKIFEIIEGGTVNPYIAKDLDGKEAILEEKDIIPIPLTPEILEKNGWKLIHGAYCHSEGKSIEIRLISQIGYCWDAYTYNYHLRSGINSVSDLQHLLFGLGLDNNIIV